MASQTCDWPRLSPSGETHLDPHFQRSTAGVCFVGYPHEWPAAPRDGLPTSELRRMAPLSEDGYFSTMIRKAWQTLHHIASLSLDEKMIGCGHFTPFLEPISVASTGRGSKRTCLCYTTAFSRLTMGAFKHDGVYGCGAAKNRQCKVPLMTILSSGSTSLKITSCNNVVVGELCSIPICRYVRHNDILLHLYVNIFLTGLSHPDSAY
ncbi:hypothetical protein PHLGIDRAFT_446903 [Phlebiopsis gigantea 11061_1 CR5-6]|uniref:Uncharacterized protein n=1 Tax=Phlebiopsis gigantea (strain 11061_1 CR5-6) TaxID=745531 RepID=A0A0C3PKC5_PHLG1|nr:hypothetical protein PHLGIDRAFT_446903 [Phlebiopsis gigantea 11061_1 CR5-6]